MQARFSSTLQTSPSMKETCHYMEGIHAQHMKSRNAARSLVKIEKPAIHLHLAGQSLHGCNFPPKEIEDLFRRRSCAEVSWRSFALGLHSETTTKHTPRWRRPTRTTQLYQTFLLLPRPTQNSTTQSSSEQSFRRDTSVAAVFVTKFPTATSFKRQNNARFGHWDVLP